MDLRVVNGRIGMIETVFDDLDERPVDCDFMLPEYLPDVAAILKCRMKPVVQSHQISGDRVIADGTVYLQLLYVDEERCCVRSYEHSQPFTSMFTVKDLKSSDAVQLSARVNYVNCRATGPRRVDVHGAFSVRLVVMAESSTEIVTEADGDGVFTRSCTVSSSVPLGCAEKTLSINEVLETGGQPIQTLVRFETAATVTECRRMAGKAVVKGDILLEAVYVTDELSGALHRHCDRLPFSQILDVEGLTEEAVCDCHARVTHCDMRPVQDPAGENRLLSVAIKLSVSMRCYGVRFCTLVTDAFHTAYPLKSETCSLEPCSISFVRADTVTLQLLQALPDGDITELTDLWCEPLAAECSVVGEETLLRGQLTVGMITRDSNGCLAYYERPMEYEAMLPDVCERMNAEVAILETVGVKNGDQLELRVQAAVHRVGMQAESCTAIARMQADETAPYTDTGVTANCCLKVCFAEAGESVWELARREHTSPEALKAENGLTEETLAADTMLLIPMR